MHKKFEENHIFSNAFLRDPKNVLELLAILKLPGKGLRVGLVPWLSKPNS